MKGIHTDVIFGEAIRQIDNEPAVRAMNKWYSKTTPIKHMETSMKARRKELIDNPKYFELTEDEIKAITMIGA